MFNFRDPDGILNFNVMNKLSKKDEELIDLAYSTTYRSSFNKIIAQCESEEAKEIVREIMEQVELEN